MIRLLTISLSYLFLLFSCGAQESIEAYEGEWEGMLSPNDSFIFTITVEDLKHHFFHVKIAKGDIVISKEVQSADQNLIQLSITDDILLRLQRTEDNERLSGFIKSGGLMYHIDLGKSEENIYTGTWKPFMVDSLQPASVFLYIENHADGTFAAYPFFGDQRFRGTYSYNFSRSADTIYFRDFNTGLKFQGKLMKDRIQLQILFADSVIASTFLSRSISDWQFGSIYPNHNQNIGAPSQLNDGWKTANITDFQIEAGPLNRMIEDIKSSKLENTHSVLIAKNGKLVFETYFDGYNADIPHDMRSASKSISSATIGIAINDHIVKDTKQLLFDCLPAELINQVDPKKSQISIHNLLTMSSGLDVSGQASEDSYQRSDNWLKTVLHSPMENNPGEYSDYGSANPFLLGICLNELLKEPVEIYMDRRLFSPLGISNYIINTDDSQAIPYFGGGMLLTSRDMLKFGQLYLNKGTWNGREILTEEWVEESFKKHTRLQDVRDKNEYGYLWWHRTYSVDDQEIESVEARGAGGQYIFVIPKLEYVVVITSGNFRNRNLLQQPEKILEEYILPAIQKE